MALEEELDNYKESSEKIDKRHQEFVSRLVADFELKEKTWIAAEQSLEKFSDQLRTELEASKRKVQFSR